MAGRASRRPVPAPRDALLGGQALVEGVMMRGPRSWAVALRVPAPEQLTPEGLADGEVPRGGIEVSRFPLPEPGPRGAALRRVPIVRGVLALGDGLRLGFAALRLSADAQLAPTDRARLTPRLWAGTIALALAIGVALFFLLPAALTKLLGDVVPPGGVAFVVVEKLLRVAIFLVYLGVVSRMAHLRRVFQYHGAEHQAIACHEAGLPLTPEHAARQSRLHPRCGTSFLLLVMLVAIVVFAPLGRLDWPLLLASRIVGIPIVAGLAFEVLRFAGRHRDSVVARVVSWPGMQLQRLTTRPPEPAQLAVALAALGAVLEADADPGRPRRYR